MHAVGVAGGDSPARSGPGSLVLDAVEEDCHPET